MTTLTFAVSRAIGTTLQPGDRIVGTRLDHDANITPWRRAADDAGAEHVLAPFDPATGQLPPQNVIDLIDEHTKWVTVPGASNLLGSTPDLAPIIEAAHDVGAYVYVDAVHLAPHRRDQHRRARLRRARHVAIQVVRPAQRRAVDATRTARVAAGVQGPPGDRPRARPARDRHAQLRGHRRHRGRGALPDRGGHGSPRRRREPRCSRTCSSGLQAIGGVTVWGSQTLEDRVPTAAFTIDGVHPADASKALGARGIAVWDGHNYAVEVVDQLGLADSGGVVRAGVLALRVDGRRRSLAQRRQRR